MKCFDDRSDETKSEVQRQVTLRNIRAPSNIRVYLPIAVCMCVCVFRESERERASESHQYTENKVTAVHHTAERCTNTSS